MIVTKLSQDGQPPFSRWSPTLSPSLEFQIWNVYTEMSPTFSRTVAHYAQDGHILSQGWSPHFPIMTHLSQHCHSPSTIRLPIPIFPSRVNQESWYNPNASSLIRSLCAEKIDKKWSDIAHLVCKLNMSKFWHTFGVFSAQDAPIELILFLLY